jgi:hypothetical protein
MNGWTFLLLFSKRSAFLLIIIKASGSFLKKRTKKLSLLGAA